MLYQHRWLFYCNNNLSVNRASSYSSGMCMQGNNNLVLIYLSIVFENIHSREMTLRQL